MANDAVFEYGMPFPHDAFKPLDFKSSPVVLKLKLKRGDNEIEADMLQPLSKEDREWVEGLWEMIK